MKRNWSTGPDEIWFNWSSQFFWWSKLSSVCVAHKNSVWRTSYNRNLVLLKNHWWRTNGLVVIKPLKVVLAKGLVETIACDLVNIFTSQKKVTCNSQRPKPFFSQTLAGIHQGFEIQRTVIQTDEFWFYFQCKPYSVTATPVQTTLTSLARPSQTANVLLTSKLSLKMAREFMNGHMAACLALKGALLCRFVNTCTCVSSKHC